MYVWYALKEESIFDAMRGQDVLGGQDSILFVYGNNLDFLA